MPTKKETLQIPDMHCEGCAERIATVLERLDGVRNADVSFEHKEARVEYDDAAVDHEDLKTAVEKAGYSVEEQPA